MKEPLQLNHCWNYLKMEMVLSFVNHALPLPLAAMSLSMCDTEGLEHGYQNLLDENGQLSGECNMFKGR